MAHAYFLVDETEAGITRARAYAEREFSLAPQNPDVLVLRYALFSVTDARNLLDIAVAAPLGDHKVIIISLTRLFHESQNALLKLFEEPPPHVTLILVIPAEGVLLQTLRSRLVPLPTEKEVGTRVYGAFTKEFLEASDAEREKLVTKLVDRSKSDKESEKQGARSEAVRFTEDLMCLAHDTKQGTRDREMRAFVADLVTFLPLLHTKSAPLKLVFEHLRLVIPKELSKAKV